MAPFRIESTCWALALGLLLVGCETDSGGKRTEGPTPPAPKAKAAALRLDAAKLCQARAEVEDLWALGTIEGRRTELLSRRQKTPRDPAAVYASLLSIENVQERWKAFSELGDELVHLSDLGSCEVYAEWKMADQAEPPCQRAEQAEPQLGLVWLARAELSARRGDVEQAKQLLASASSKTPGCLPVWTRQARLLAKGGDDSAALAAYDKALTIDGKCASCAIERAELVEKAQGKEAAIPAWEAALALVPTHGPTLSRYASAQEGKDDKKALAAYEQALTTKGDDVPTLLAAAKLAQKTGEMVKAVEHAERAADLQADSAEIWRLLVALYVANNEATGLEKALAEVLRLAPDDPFAHHLVGKTAITDEDFVSALEHLELAVAGFADLDKSPPELLEATDALDKLKQELLISEPGPSGDANRVVGQVQGTARRVFEARLKKKRGLKGNVQLKVRTNKSGEVQSVEITQDTLKDARVAASLVGNLRAASIDGGAQNLSFELSFE